MAKDDNVEEDFLRRNREQLRYWPYTLYQIDETLDIALIEGKAKQILFQSLNSKSLCAFAGSGLSASYGRLSWSKWKDEQIQIVRRNAEAFLNLSKISSEWIQELATIINDKDPNPSYPDWAKSVYDLMNPRSATPEEDKRKRENRRNIWGWLEARRRSILMAEHEVRLLFDTFHQASSDEGSFPGGDALPVQFEIAQQLHNQIRKHVSFFLLPSEDGETISKFKDVWTGSRASPESAAPKESIDVLMIALEIGAGWKEETEEIPKYCKTAKAYQKAWKHFAKESQFGASHLAFEDVTKYLLIDENAHAALLLRDGLSRSNKQNAEDVAAFEHGLGLFDGTKLKRDVDGIRRAPERYLSLAPFNFEALFQAFELASQQAEYGNWKTIFTRIKEDLDTYRSKSEEQGDERIFLTPSSRFLLAIALRLLKDPMTNGSDGRGFLDKHVTAPPATSFSSRRSIIADRFDPLAKTIRKLGIRRYITTNYDFEIERFFTDAGFNNFGNGPLALKTAEDHDFRSDHLGAVLRDQTFHRDQAAELIAFSMGRTSQNASVFHLHGRATKEDSLVISERDYLELYLAEDENRESVDEAINLAFSSAPMLFIGLGMTEADMLRPLRQFISNRDRTVGYSALTLLPAEKSYAERVKTASSLYLRYGVHTIFYGSGEVLVQKPEEHDTSPVGLDWLHRILAVTGAVTKHIGRMQDEVKEALADKEVTKQGLSCVSKKGNWPTKFVGMLDKAVGAMGSDLAIDSPVKAEERALNVLFGLTSWAADSKSDDLKRLRARKIAEMIKSRQSEKTNIVIPTLVPVRPRNYEPPHDTKSARVRLDTTEYVAFYVQILEDMLRLCINDRHEVYDKAAWETLQHDLAARQIALDGLWGAFISTSLNAMLDSLEGEWRAWWEDWQDPPAHRTPKFECFRYFSYLPKESGGSGQPDDCEQPNDGDQPDSDELPDFGGLRHTVEAEIAARALLPTPLRYIRHRVENSITDMKEAETLTAPPQLQLNDQGVVSLEHRTNIRAFDTFIAAIAAERAVLAETDRFCISDPIPNTRRFYTVAALRGQGKGTFMTAMSSRLGLSMYIRAGWPVYGVSKDGVDIVLPNQTRCAIFAGAIFVNFSFSSEISSAYDMLLDAVTETTARVQALHKVLLDQKPKLDADVQDKLIRSAVQNEKLTMGDDGFDELWSAFQKQVEECEIRPRKDADVLSRMGAIKKAFSDFQNASRSFKDSKLRFATQLCIPRLLICINGIDLLYESAGREGAAKNGEIAAIISILTGDETSKVPFDLVVIGSESGIGVPWRQLRNAPKPTEGEKDVLPLVLKQIDRQNIPGPAREHIERRKASTTLNIVAPNDKEAEFDGYIHFARPVSPTEMMICNFPTLAKVLFLLNITSADGRDKIGVHHLEEQGEGSLSRLNVEAQKEEASELEEIWSQAEVPELGKLAKARNNARARINETLTQAIDELGSEAGLDIERGYLRERYQSKNKVDIDEWHRIRRHLGGNRFCLTILLGAAQHIVEHSRVLLDGAKAAEAFIRHTVDQVRNIGVYQKEDFVLRSVLECYRRYNVLGDYAA
ncbi:MAG: SIR2 family protein, partial [Paracoccaceae bacterium]